MPLIVRSQVTVLSVAVTCCRRSSTVRISWTIHSSRRRRCWMTSAGFGSCASCCSQANQARVQRSSYSGGDAHATGAERIGQPGFVVALLAAGGFCDRQRQFAALLGCDPDAGQVANPFEVGQHAGVGEVGFIGRLLHAGDESGMGQVDGPGEAVGDSLCGWRAVTGFRQGGALDHAEASHGSVEGIGGVVHGSVAEQLALGIEDAELNVVLGVIQSDEEWYSGLHVRMLCTAWLIAR